MKPSISHYLRRERTRCERTASFATRFRLPAIQLLLVSRAYAVRDWPGLAVLARDLRAENLGTIRLAQKYPDVFHPNVIASRRAENAVYDAVIRLVAGHHASKAPRDRDAAAAAAA